MEDPMDKDAFRTLFEINAIVVGSVAKKPLSLALDDPEYFRVQIFKIVRQELELRQQFELKFLRNTRYFGCADLVKDNLIHGTLLRSLQGSINQRVREMPCFRGQNTRFCEGRWHAK